MYIYTGLGGAERMSGAWPSSLGTACLDQRHHGQMCVLRGRQREAEDKGCGWLRALLGQGMFPLALLDWGLHGASALLIAWWLPERWRRHGCKDYQMSMNVCCTFFASNTLLFALNVFFFLQDLLAGLKVIVCLKLLTVKGEGSRWLVGV